jgi:hypothetical protein
VRFGHEDEDIAAVINGGSRADAARTSSAAAWFGALLCALPSVACCVLGACLPVSNGYLCDSHFLVEKGMELLFVHHFL